MTVADYEQRLLERAAEWPEHACWRGLSVDVLKQVAAQEGVDFATALLYDRLVRSPEHGPFIEHIRSGLESDDTGRPEGTLAIVPGACYVEYPATGADGRRLRAVAEQLGWQVEVVPVHSFGPLETNAQTICTWLDERSDEPVLLVSLSKGGADVKTALARPDAWHAFRNVVGWINVSGIVFGTPLAGWVLRHWFRKLLTRLSCWCRGYEFSVLGELDRFRGCPLEGEFVLPPWVRLVHVVGLPLSVHLDSKRARRGHRRLASLGPNDGGGILLGDVCRLPGLIYPVWGADHYLEPDWDIRPLIRRILRFVLDMNGETGSVGSVCHNAPGAGDTDRGFRTAS